MALFGSNWSDDYMETSGDDQYKKVKRSYSKTTKEILDGIDIKDIENYLRKKS